MALRLDRRHRVQPQPEMPLYVAPYPGSFVPTDPNLTHLPDQGEHALSNNVHQPSTGRNTGKMSRRMEDDNFGFPSMAAMYEPQPPPPPQQLQQQAQPSSSRGDPQAMRKRRPEPEVIFPPQGGAREEAFMGTPPTPAAKKSRTNTPWTAAEELKLRQMREAGNTWADIAKGFPLRTEGSVKKHWYKDMHYAEFAEAEEVALLDAIKDYEANKWKTVGAIVGKPAKACEQFAKEHFRKEQLRKKSQP